VGCSQSLQPGVRPADAGTSRIVGGHPAACLLYAARLVLASTTARVQRHQPPPWEPAPELPKGHIGAAEWWAVGGALLLIALLMVLVRHHTRGLGPRSALGLLRDLTLGTERADDAPR
jgi:hypothetical protein